MFDSSVIVERFLDTKLQVHPDVVRYICEKKDENLIDQIISGVPDDCLVVSLKHVPGIVPSREGVRFLSDPEVEIISGRTGTARPVAKVEDYISYFSDRFGRLSGMIRGRCSPVPIEAIRRNSRYRQEEFSVCGMVVDVRSTGNGHRMAELEDPTGSVNVLFNKDRPDFAEAERIVPDEVIGVRGSLSNEGNLIFADQIFRPDIPFSHVSYTSERKGAAVLISDIHVGSDTFLEDAWNRFADWLCESEVSYLLVAGDLVDGIGIYPDQDKELVITNIHEQCDMLGKMLAKLPSHIRIILSPGNHDVVRVPSHNRQFRRSSGVFPDSCIFVENPALINLQGVRFYAHGRSFDDLISLMPGASYEKACDIIPEMLKRRHLAPCYGRRTPIAADIIDRLIIDPIPEVVHTGHVHIYGISRCVMFSGLTQGHGRARPPFRNR